MVVGDMIGASSEFKVCKSVIVLDFVAVVDVFVGAESAAKMLFHDVAMFENVESSAGELNVSVFTDSACDVCVAAFARAETHHSALGSAWLDVEAVSARFAGESDSHVIAPSR
jgi:hypothetical protein